MSDAKTKPNPAHRHVVVRTSPSMDRAGMVMVYLDERLSENEFRQHEVYKRLREMYSMVICIPNTVKARTP